MSYVSSEKVNVGEQAPPFTLHQVGGEPMSLSDLQGTPAVLVFLRGFF